MSKCEKCGVEVPTMFGCCFCQRPFCSEHVLPVSHQCSKSSELLEYFYAEERGERPRIRGFRKTVFFVSALSLLLVLSSVIMANNMTQLRNLTYQEALQFIHADQTDRNIYLDGKYTCVNFAKDFKINAAKLGYRCGYVVVLMVDWSHAINCFNTTDSGLIFVEPQKDEIVMLTVGQPYWDRAKYAPQYPSSYNDTVIGFQITW